MDITSPAQSPKRSPARPRRPIPNRRGVTMMETALATILVGLSVLSVLKLITVVTQQGTIAQKSTTALMLADNIRELTNGLPYNDVSGGTGNHLGPLAGKTALSQFTDVQCFNNFTASPPIDAHGQPITNMANWQQVVTVTHVNPNNFQLTDSLAGDSACVLDRVQVAVSYQPNASSSWIPILTVEWLKAKLQ